MAPVLPMNRTQLERQLDHARQLRAETLQAVMAYGGAAARPAFTRVLRVVLHAIIGVGVLRRP